MVFRHGVVIDGLPALTWLLQTSSGRRPPLRFFGRRHTQCTARGWLSRRLCPSLPVLEIRRGPQPTLRNPGSRWSRRQERRSDGWPALAQLRRAAARLPKALMAACLRAGQRQHDLRDQTRAFVALLPERYGKNPLAASRFRRWSKWATIERTGKRIRRCARATPPVCSHQTRE